MRLLETALAFSLVMIIFSVMVTAIMEIIYRLLSSREKLFELTMERMFHQVVWPLVRKRLTEATMEQARIVFIHALTSNPVGDSDEKRRKLMDFGAPQGLTGLSVMEFMERLGSTEIGKAIAAEGEMRVTAIVNDISQKFERFSKGAKERLTQRSLGYSLWISFGLAFALNIDAVNIFHFYMTNQTARQQIIAQQLQIEEAKTVADSVKTDAKADLVQIEEQIDGLKMQIAGLQSDGLPMGYDLYPGCARQIRSGSFADGRCAVKSDTADVGAWEGFVYNLKNDQLGMLFWFVSVLLGGLLVGLGAPFWFNVASGLSGALQVLKAFKGSSSAKDGEGTIGGGSLSLVANPGESPPPRTPVEAFTTAIAAAPRNSGSRILLASDGTIGGE